MKKKLTITTGPVHISEQAARSWRHTVHWFVHTDPLSRQPLKPPPHASVHAFHAEPAHQAPPHKLSSRTWRLGHDDLLLDDAAEAVVVALGEGAGRLLPRDALAPQCRLRQRHLVLPGTGNRERESISRDLMALDPRDPPVHAWFIL
jgi:hypothetical protein